MVEVRWADWQQEELSEKDEEKINEHIYEKQLPEIMSYTMMKIIHNEVEKNKTSKDLEEKESQVKALGKWKALIGCT